MRVRHTARTVAGLNREKETAREVEIDDCPDGRPDARGRRPATYHGSRRSAFEGIKQGGYTLTQLDTGINSASVVQHLSENGVAIGDVLAPEFKNFAWSAQTGLVLLTLGGTQSVATAVSQRHRDGRVRTTGDGPSVASSGPSLPASPRSATSVAISPFRRVSTAAVPLWRRPDKRRQEPRVHVDEEGRHRRSGPGCRRRQRPLGDRRGVGRRDNLPETTEQIFIWTEKNGLETIGALSNVMRPDYVNSHGDLTGPYFNEDGSAGTCFWSRTTGLIDIGTLGGTEIYPTALSETGTVVGFGTTATGEAHAFVWSGPGTLAELGTLGGDFSFANAVKPAARSSATVRRPAARNMRSRGPRPAGWWTWARWAERKSSANFVTDSGTDRGNE